MVDYLFRAPTARDCEILARSMRQCDMDEVRAACGRSLDASDLLDSVNNSPICVAVERNGRLLCIGGAARRSLLSTSGIPWMLGTHDLDSNGRLFMQHGRQCVSVLLGRFSYLENYVDARNLKSIRWLKRMGFAVHDPEPYGCAGLHFRRFSASG